MAEPKFAETWCSQCGEGFGPGNHGYSHCRNHDRKAIAARIRTDAVNCPDLADLIQMAFAEAYVAGKDAGENPGNAFFSPSIDKAWRDSEVVKLLPDEFHLWSHT